MGVPVNHKRMKQKYSPVMNAAEKRHKAWIKSLPCIGCGAVGRSDAHHTLLSIPGKRWRRDHEFLIPVCWDCHQGPRGIHGIGNELTWCERNNVDTRTASKLRAESIGLGILTCLTA